MTDRRLEVDFSGAIRLRSGTSITVYIGLCVNIVHCVSYTYMSVNGLLLMQHDK